MTHPTDQSSREQEREAFEAWWFNPASADNSKRYKLTVDDMRQMAEDVTWKAWQARAALSTLPPTPITAEEAGREGEAKDTERLDWLEKHFTHISGIFLDSLNCVQHFEVDCEEDTLESGTTRIREAIDAAMLPPTPAQSGGQG